MKTNKDYFLEGKIVKKGSYILERKVDDDLADVLEILSEGRLVDGLVKLLKIIDWNDAVRVFTGMRKERNR